MKKRELIVGAIALTGTVAGMVSMQVAYAAVTCSNASVSAPTVCTGTTGSYLAEAFTITGSNGVQINATDSTAEVQICGSHMNGAHAYGLTSNGGSMETKAGTAITNGSGGCG